MPVTTLALIPARSGSKGIPGKNTRWFRSKPLIAWAVETAYASGVSAIAASSDSWKILDEATKAGPAIPILRPEALATDETPMLAVVQHALGFLAPYRWDVVVLLQPTQPLRLAKHVREALRLLEETGADSVVSVVEIPAHYSPDYALRMVGLVLDPFLETETHAAPLDGMLMRRQDTRKVYSRDGTVYAIRRQTIDAGALYGYRSLPLIIPRSESVNLDTEEDWAVAEARA